MNFKIIKDCPHFDEKSLKCTYDTKEGNSDLGVACLECGIALFELREKKRKEKK